MGQIDPAIEALFLEPTGVMATTPAGERVPLDECSWLLMAPCGCSGGIVLAVSGGDAYLTPEAAMKEMYDREAARKAKDGWYARLILHSDFGRVVAPMWKGTYCGHDPQWGVKPTTRTVDGVTFTRRSAERWEYGDKRRLEKNWNGAWWAEGSEPTYLGHELRSAMRKAAELVNAQAVTQ
jgi:hypothetical protein